MPEVSVVIPVYNRPQLLKDAVTSVLNQTLTRFEIIIVDDGSTDETAIVADELCSKSGLKNRCRCLHLPHSGYPGAARNYGVLDSKSRYIAFLDSDDVWDEHKLEKQLKYMKANKCKISHTKEIWQRNDRIISQKGQKHKRQGDIFLDALKKCIIGPSTVMMERELFLETGGFNERIEIAEDYEYWLRICNQQELGYIQEPLTIKRAGNWEQLSEKYGKIELFRMSALASLLDINLPAYKVEQQYLKAYSWHGFTKANKIAAFKELCFKCEVWAAGCKKRKRISEYEEFNVIIKQLKEGLLNGFKTE